MPLSRRSLLLGLVFPALAGCDDEGGQRKAFIAFLQARILDKPGLQVPKLDEAAAKPFGPYAGQYAIITDFHAALNERTKGLNEEMRSVPSSLAELQSRRGEIERVRGALSGLGTALDAEHARAAERRAALQQPADLKPVFDAAFERAVTSPYRTVKDMLPTLGGGLDALMDMIAFLDTHRAEVKVSGSTLQVSNPALQRDLQAKLDTVRARGQASVEAGRRMQALLSGR